jgi:DNA-3-methyladenine glycosylase
MVLVSFTGDQLTAGMIVETEAYSGRNDRACHAHQNRLTKRTAIMFQEGGHAYVYLCYGIHHLFNIITNEHNLADAVLIRAVEPLEGIPVIQQRRKIQDFIPRLSSGPGLVCQALNISREHYGTDLLGNLIWLEDRGLQPDSDEITAGPRIGVDYAGEDALLPWRFWIRNNPFVSKPGNSKKQHK